MTLNNLFSILKGGPTSGNYGHSGRPGKKGGSGRGVSSQSLKDFYTNVVAKLGTSGTEELHGYDKSGKLIGITQGDEGAGTVPGVKGAHTTIHNHPDESTFSTGDFQTQLEERSQVMYVVTPGGKVYKSSITPQTPPYDPFKMRDLVDSVKQKNGFYDKVLEDISQGKISKSEARNRIKEAVVSRIIDEYALDYEIGRI